MATARTKTAKATEAEAPVAEAPKKPSTKTVVKVQNQHGRFFYVHPATGTRIGAGEIKELPRDGWLDMQIAAGILKEV